MDIQTAMENRSSCRSYLDESVSHDLIREILSDASRAPSALNMQPWEIHVVMGPERKRLSRQLIKSYRERGITCGPGASKQLPGVFMARARKCADDMVPLVQKMGIDFKEFVNEGSLNFYGAPCVVFIFMDDSFPPERMVDAGAFMGFLTLAAFSKGLGSCPIGLANSYSGEIRDFLNIPESKNLVISVALGKTDSSKPINGFRTQRATLDEVIRWID